MNVGGFVDRLFETFQPRQMCMNYETDVIVLNAASDVMIMAAYYSIPLALFYLVRKRNDIEFGWMLMMFAAFIVLCGTTHLFDIIALWKPMYRLDGVVKLVTGLVSVATAIALWPLIPVALSIPHPRQLQQANDTLKLEVEERRRAQVVAESRARQLRDLTVQLTTVEERERHHLAMILHDHVQQLLAAAQLNLSRIERTPQTDGTTSGATVARQCVTEAIQMCRSLTAQLSPTILYDAGLAPAIDWLGRRMKELHGLDVRLETEQLDPEPTESVGVFLYQAARELLFNVKKHSGVESANVKLWRNNGMVHLTVEDAGIGFDSEEVERKRSENSFGLFSIRERLNAVNGTFEIDSRRGYTLIHLAMADEEEDSEVPSREFDDSIAPWTSGQEADLPPVRIVLVDDHQVLRDSLKSNLRQIPGVTIVGEASDGQTAVELARAVRPDIIVMDMVMPGMNGVEATKLILRDQPKVRIVGLSMYNEPYMIERMMNAGAVRYLSKTASFEDLQRTLAELRADIMGDEDGRARPSPESSS